jgi:hypothetical protein
MRHKDDFYRTPGWVTRLILPYLPQNSSKILEPCAGEGAILRTLRQHYPDSKLFGIEIDPLRHQSLRDQEICDHTWCADLLTFSYFKADLIITNPPFSIILEIAQHCLMLAKENNGTVVLLGKLSYLATHRRYRFHKENPCDVYVLSQRPSFTEGGTDRAIEYGWFVYHPDCEGKIKVLWSKERAQELERGPKQASKKK